MSCGKDRKTITKSCLGLAAWAGVSGGMRGAAYRPPVERPRTFQRPGTSAHRWKAREYEVLWGVYRLSFLQMFGIRDHQNFKGLSVTTFYFIWNLSNDSEYIQHRRSKYDNILQMKQIVCLNLFYSLPKKGVSVNYVASNIL